MFPKTPLLLFVKRCTHTPAQFLRFVEQSTEPIIQPQCSPSYCVNYGQSYGGV